MNVGFIDWWGNEIPFSEVAGTSACHWSLPKQIIVMLAASCHRERYADISVTELFMPLRKYLLQQRHDYFVYPEKVFDRFEGTAMHNILAAEGSVKHGDDIRELKLVTEIEGISFGGTSDHYSGGIITDYKWTKHKTLARINKMGIATAKPRWCEQLNAYGWLMQKAGYEVHELQLWLRIKDAAWGKESPLVGIGVSFMNSIKELIHGRVAEFLRYRDAGLPSDCKDCGKLCGYCEVEGFCRESK